MSIKKRTLFKVFGNPSASTSQVGEILRIMRPEHVNATNREGRNVLMEAIIASHSEDVILTLLEKQPDPMIMDYEEETALHHAARHANANVVERMLELGFDVSARNAYTQTPLLVAVNNTKDERVIHLLIEHGADIKVKASGNDGVMLHAARNKFLDLLSYFKSLGLSDTVIDDSGKNCLHNGIIHDLPVERIKALLHLPFVSAPKKPLELTEEELEYATYKSRIPSAMILASIYSSDSAVLQLLIDRGASVEDCDDVFKRTPLMHAVVNERPKEFIELLIEAGTDLLAVDRDQMTALELAAKYNSGTKLFEMLTKKYEKLEGAGNVLVAAWGLAGERETYSEFHEIFVDYIVKSEVRMLFDLYEDVETRPMVASLMKRWEGRNDTWRWSYRDELTPLMIAAREEPAEVVELLLDRGANIIAGSPILETIDGDVVENFKLLLNWGADLEDVSVGFGMSAFEFAIKSQSNAILQEMLNTEMHDPLEGEYQRSHKASVKEVEESLDQRKGTVIANYAVRYAEDIEEYIIGSPPIVLAAIYGDVKTLEVLLEAGADINSRDYTINKTPLMWAIDTYDLEMDDTLSKVEYLLKHGANLIELEDDEGRSSYDYMLRVFEYEELRNLLSLSPFNTPLDLWFKEVAILEKLAQDPAHVKVLKKFIPAWEEYRDDGNIKLLIPPLAFSSREDKWLEATKLLLTNGSDVNFMALTGWTPIVFASNARSEKNAHLLVENGADVNISLGHEIKITLLEFILAGRMFPASEIVAALLAGGAVITGDSSRTIDKQREALREQGREGEIDLDNDPYFKKMFVARELIGSPALILAIQHDDDDLLRLCLDAGADVNSEDYGPMRRTALMWACQSCIENVENWGGDLFDSISDDEIEGIKLLIDHGADLMLIKDAEGRIGLDYMKQILTVDGFFEFLQYLQTGWKSNNRDLLGGYDAETLCNLLAQTPYGLWFKEFNVFNELVKNPEYANVLDEDIIEKIKDWRDYKLFNNFFLKNIWPTPLVTAALFDNVEVVKLLLNHGAKADILINSYIQMTLLELYLACAFFGEAEIVTSLIAGGASIEGDPGRTFEKQVEALRKQGKEMELDKVSKTYHKEFSGNLSMIGSPFITIASDDIDFNELAEIIIEAGADVNAQDYSTAKRTPLMWACQKMFKLIFEEGCDLFDSISNDEIEGIKLLIDHGADLMLIKDAEGRIGLDYMKQILTVDGFFELLQYLQTGWKSNNRDLLGGYDAETLCNLLAQTPYGLWFKEFNVFNELVKNPEYANVLDEDIIEKIKDWRDYELFNNFFLQNFWPTPLVMAAIFNNVEVVKLLLDYGAKADILINSYIRMTLLEFYLACVFFPEAEIVASLIAGGASIEGDPGRTFEKQVEALRKQGKEIELEEVSELYFEYFPITHVPPELIGSPVITTAGCFSDPELFKVLSEAGADVDSQDYFATKRTALMWACQRYIELYADDGMFDGLIDSICSDDKIGGIKFLLDQGADLINIKDAEGRTGLDYMKQILSDEGMEELAEYLKARGYE